MNNKKREVVIIYHNHLDPEWARCYDRPVFRNSVYLRSYADVWEYIINTWLDMADEGFGYTEGQYIVWRTYLNRHPEKKERIKELIKNGRLEILLQGELTPETNYLPAEGLSRNYLLAKDFYEEFCGKDYKGTKLAWIWDAFGNSANMPQILKLAGAEMVGGTRYRSCKEDIWEGIDGTKIPCIDKRFGIDSGSKEENILYGLSRHAHCPECKGYGCKKCNGSGMIFEHNFKEEEVLLFLKRAADEKEDKKFVLIGGEEVLPHRCILNAVAALNQEYEGEVVFRFGGLEEFWDKTKEYYAEALTKDTNNSPDLNPVHQGCYITRIENKQRVRAITYRLLQAEALEAAKAWREGFHKPDQQFTVAWRDLLLNMHHDSISGAHIDNGQKELMDYLDEAESIAAQYVLRKKTKQINRIEGKECGRDGKHFKTLGRMKVCYDRKGILSVVKNERDLFGDFTYKNMTFTGNSSRKVRIGELTLQCDWGDNHNAYFLGDNVLLGDYNYDVYEDERGILWRGRHEAMDPEVKVLEWEIRVESSDDGEKLNYTVNINWDTSNKRVRAVIPVADDTKKSVWEIPYGFIERAFDPDNMLPFKSEFGAIATRPIGEFAAMHWVKHEIDSKTGVVILNKGIPSAKWIPGCFELSLLRSPTMTGDTVLPSVDEMWDVDGLRDSGNHCFEFSVWPYTEAVSNAEITKEGYAFNDALLEVPFDLKGDVIVTAFKLAESGDGCILRINEINGCDSKMTITFKECREVQEVDLFENPTGTVCNTIVYERMLHKHEILTLLIR